METLVQQIVNGLVLGSMYALVALGYTMVYGVLNLINFAHGDVMMIGAMVGVTILQFIQHAAPGLPGVVKLMIAIICAIPICVIVNVLIERVAYRKLRDAPRLAPLITAIGVSILLQTAAMMIWGRSPIPFPGVMPFESWRILGARISPTQVMVLVLAVASMLALLLLIERTKTGRAMRATAENLRIAGLMGIDSNRVIVLTFAIGATLAAVTGVMWGALYSSAQFPMGLMPGLKAFTAAVLGGIGNIYGAMLGGLLLGLIESLGAGYISSQYADVFAFVVLIGTLVFRPSGIMGERVADRA